MKIVLDIDATINEYNEFIYNNAVPYFEKKYGMKVVKPYCLDVEDIMDMKSFFIEKNNCNEQEALLQVRKVLNKFWYSKNAIKLAFCKLRPGVKEYISNELEKGSTIEIHSSKREASQTTRIGSSIRNFICLQYRLRGINIPKENYHFYENDEQKIEGIVNTQPDIVFEDKPEILNALISHKINCICVNGNHNQELDETIIRVDDFKNLENKLSK